MLPEMAIRNGILNNTDIVARPLKSEHAYRSVALVWRKNSPREKEFRLLAQILRDAAQIGRAHVWTPVTNAQLVCRLLLVKQKSTQTKKTQQDNSKRHNRLNR